MPQDDYLPDALELDQSRTLPVDARLVPTTLGGILDELLYIYDGTDDADDPWPRALLEAYRARRSDPQFNREEGAWFRESRFLSDELIQAGHAAVSDLFHFFDWLRLCAGEPLERLP